MRAHVILAMNTLAFTMCFSVWMLNGVLVTFLVEQRLFDWTPSQMGMLMGAPVLTGAIMRLPLGIATDRFGGRPVFALLMLAAAVPTFLLGSANSYGQFLAASFAFGLTGASFAVGIAFTSVWYAKQRQGTALGIFGAGNAGAAITTLVAPGLLEALTAGGEYLEGWRLLPQLCAWALAGTAVLFFLLTQNRLPAGGGSRTLARLLSPLKSIRVWRFGLYYFLVFGGFVALAQWLVPYYVNVYGMSLAMAGLLASLFSFPSGVIRILGGWLSDRCGATPVMYWILAITALCCLLLIPPRMVLESPGRGVMALLSGTVTEVASTHVRVDDRVYRLQLGDDRSGRSELVENILPVIDAWQEPVVNVGDAVERRTLLARGLTRIRFEANVWIFSFLVLVIGITTGIGKAAVYRYIPDYFPDDVGVVGGMVGVLGALGGFVLPILFGALLDWFGLWTTSWALLLMVTLACLAWLSRVAPGPRHRM